MLKIFLVAALFSASAGFAQQRSIAIDSIKVDGDLINVSFSVDNLINEKVKEGLDKGLIVTVVYEIQLWRSRSNWFDDRVGSKVIGYKLGYNKFNKRYIWMSENERRATTSFERVERLTSNIINLTIADTSDVNQRSDYYIVAEGILKPVSVDNFEEMGKWLRGEIEGINTDGSIPSPKKSQEKITGGFLSFIKNVTGFGDIYYEGRSRGFNFILGWRVKYDSQ